MIKHIHRNHLCCEAIVRRMPNRELLLVCQCDDLTEPAPLNRVYFWHSKDDGNTWSNRQLIMKECNRAVYCTEVNVIDDEVFCYITLHNGSFLDYECIVLKSKDNGHHWENMGKLPPLEGFTFVRGLIKLQDGTLLLPYQQYLLKEDEENELLSSLTRKYIWNIEAKNCQNGVYISYDNGKTFVKGGECEIPLYVNNAKRWAWTEPTIVQLSDHRIVMLLRVDNEGYLYRSDSFDNGKTFTKPYKTDILNPNNKVKLIKMEDGRIALVHTPNATIGFKGRQPLQIWISDDDMKTFQYKKDLVTFPGWISYPDGFIENNCLYLSFEFNRHDLYFIKEEL